MESFSLAKEYSSWIGKQISVSEISPSCYEITLPYTDSASDCLQIYVQKEGNFIFLTDGGDTIRYLQYRGLSLTDERKDLIRQMIQPYHVYLSGENALILETDCQLRLIPPAVHALVQAMLRVDMLGHLKDM